MLMAAWLVPGLGHLMYGKKQLGTILLVLIAGIFVVGLVMSDFSAVSRDLNPYSFFAQIGIGGGTLPLLWLDPGSKFVLSGHAQTETFSTVPFMTDTGVLFCNIAGLLNILVVLDIADRLRGGKVQIA